jgi:hypothetical protein
MMDNYNSGQGQGWPDQPCPPLGPAPWQPQRERLSSVFIIIIILIALLIPMAGPVISIILGLIFIKRLGSTTLIVAGCILLVVQIVVRVLFASLLLFLLLGASSMNESNMKMSFEAISDVLSNYSLDHDGAYPKELNKLNDLDDFAYNHSEPLNPLTERAMHNVPFGSKDCFGEYTYVPYVSNGKVTGYYLIGYGTEKTEGQDVDGDGVPDHVISVLYSRAYDEYSYKPIPGTSDWKPMPPLKELLKSQKRPS